MTANRNAFLIGLNSPGPTSRHMGTLFQQTLRLLPKRVELVDFNSYALLDEFQRYQGQPKHYAAIRRVCGCVHEAADCLDRAMRELAIRSIFAMPVSQPRCFRRLGHLPWPRVHWTLATFLPEPRFEGLEVFYANPPFIVEGGNESVAFILISSTLPNDLFLLVDQLASLPIFVMGFTEQEFRVGNH